MKVDYDLQPVAMGGLGAMLLLAAIAAILSVCRPIEDRITNALIPPPMSKELAPSSAVASAPAPRRDEAERSSSIVLNVGNPNEAPESSPSAESGQKVKKGVDAGGVAAAEQREVVSDQPKPELVRADSNLEQQAPAPTVELCGIPLGVSFDDLKRLCVGLEMHELDMKETAKWGAEEFKWEADEASREFALSRESWEKMEQLRADAFFMGKESLPRFDKWTDQQWDDYKRGRASYMSSFPGWTTAPNSSGYDGKSIRDFLCQSGWHYHNSYHDCECGEVPPWNVVLVNGAPKGKESILFTVVKWAEGSGVIQVIVRYKPSVVKQVAEAALCEKYGPPESNVAVKRGREISNVGGTLVIGEEKDHYEIKKASNTWRPTEGVRSTLNDTFAVVEVDLVAERVTQSLEGRARRLKAGEEEARDRKASGDLGL